VTVIECINASGWALPDGFAVVGFMGQDGDEIDQLALVYAAY
jgi:hypothetical protein